MFWADKIVAQIKKDIVPSRPPSRRFVIRDEKTMSGRIHVGSMRGVAVHGIVSEILKDENISSTFYYEINDLDPFDGIPAYLDEERYVPYLGKPLYAVPAPDESAENFAEHFSQEFIGVIEGTGFHPEYYRARDLYRSGRMNEAIRIALEKADLIRAIYKDVSGSVKKDWLPISVICEHCGRIGTTRAISFDGKKVAYRCEENFVSWAKGCGYSGVMPPFDGNGKLPWKVEWAAKFFTLDVAVEGGGKDQSTRGGARDVANRIAEEVYGVRPPLDIPYEFITVGGRKMSTSKGEGSSAEEIASLLPPVIFRLFLLGKNIGQAVDFIPDGETIPLLFDRHDRIAEKYWSGVDDDDTRLFELIHPPETRKNLSRLKRRFLPRFSQIAFLAQMPHIKIEEEILKMKGDILTPDDHAEMELRSAYAKKWLALYAPEEYKYELQTGTLPDAVKTLTGEQKRALKAVLLFVRESYTLDGQEFHTKLHDIRKGLGIEPKAFFGALYLSFLGKESGPKAGWFLSVLEKDFLEKRLEEASKETKNERPHAQ